MLSLNKYLKTSKLLFVVCLFLLKNNISQNLIQNGSFELTTNINCSTGPILNVDDWEIIQSPDYFIALCNGIGTSGVPNNNFGSCFPKDGNAYVGLATLGLPHERKEYIYQHLISPLIGGKSYYTSFFLSKSDRTRIATEKIGTYFSVAQPTVAPGTTVCLIATPQIENQLGFLTDTVNWVKIEGYFTAQGGEQYITIGNFNSNANTDTLYTGTNNPFIGDVGNAYYYIDSVSLYDSLDYVTNIKNHENDFKLNLYPNPNNGNFTLKYNLAKYSNADLLIYDVTGKVLSKTNLLNTVNQLDMNVDKFESGVYYYTIRTTDEILNTNKFVIIK